MLMAIFVAYSTSGVTSGKIFRHEFKWRLFWKCLNIKHSFNLTSEMKRSSQIMQEKLFSWWWRHRWRHRTTSKSFLYIPLWMQNNIFHDNWRTYKDIIFKLNALMYHWIVNTPLQTIMDCFIDDVIGSQNRSKLWTQIALSIFELEHRSKAQNVTNAHGYLCSIFNFRCHFR